MRSTYRYRSFFWPAILILAGVIALLVNTGQIPAERLYNLFLLWPLILIVLGLELIVRRSLHGVAGDIAAALIILLAVAGAAAYTVAAPNPSSTQAMDFSADLGSISQGSLEIDAGAATIRVTGGGDVGSSLYKAHIEYTGSRPQITLDRSTGKLVIDQANRGSFSFTGVPRFVLDLQLNTSIPWRIAQNTGAATDTYNLQSVQVGGITLNTGASRDEISLGRPSGIVSVQVNGGSLTVRVHRPQGVSASVDVNGGVISVDADGHAYHGIGEIAVGNASGDGYKVEVNGGACNVSLDSSGGSD